MKTPLFCACFLLASGVRASDNFPTFSFNFARLRAIGARMDAPPSRASDVISSIFMIVHAGNDGLFGYADTAAEASQAIAYWTGVLKSVGIQVGAPTFVDGQYKIPYRTADGRIIRGFLADPRQFPPKNEAGLRANMALSREALAKAGLDVVAAHVLDVDISLPTYTLLYLTRADANYDHEIRLRVMRADMNFDVWREAGVNVVQTVNPGLMVYLGQLLGYTAVIGRNYDEIVAKLAAREEFLKSEGKRLIARRIFPIDDSTEYKFAAAIYFFH